MPVLAKLRSDVVRVVESARTVARRRRRRGRRRQRAARRACPTAARRAERPRDPARSRCAASPRCTPRCPDAAVVGVRRDRHRRRRPGRSSTPAPPRSRSAPPCCTTPPPPTARGRARTEDDACTRPKARRPFGAARPRRAAPSAASSAPASTRTPRCSHDWGLDDDVGRARAVRARRGRGGRAVRLGGQAAVGVLRAVRQPRRRGPGAGDRGLRGPPARWCCST